MKRNEVYPSEFTSVMFEDTEFFNRKNYTEFILEGVVDKVFLHDHVRYGE